MDASCSWLAIPMTGRSWFSVLALVVSLSLWGCSSAPPRQPIPRDLVTTADIPGFENIRFYGDVYTPAFDKWLVEKDRAVAAAVADGRMPKAATYADFLALSGGGDKGAFAAGLLKGWSDRGDRPSFEGVSGVSAGALAAPFVFLGPSYDSALNNIYTELGAESFFRSRGVFGFFHDALNDTAPLKGIILKYATDAFLDSIGREYELGRRVFVLTTNLDAQRPVIWDLSAIAASKNPGRRELFAKVLLASSALPGLFPPVEIPVVAKDGKTYTELHVDGGVSAEMLFAPPEVNILKVEDMFFKSRRTRSLYVIENGQITPDYETPALKLLPLAQRSVQTLVKFQIVADLRALERVSKANNTTFQFQAIPITFDPVSPKLFDRVYSKKLYEAGQVVGSSGQWFTKTEESPELYSVRGKPMAGKDVSSQ